jgi:hypothetical protein
LFHFHFTPTSASWRNAVEGLLRTRQRLNRGIFSGIADLQATINRYLADTTTTPSRSSGPPTPTPSSKRYAVETGVKVHPLDRVIPNQTLCLR